VTKLNLSVLSFSSAQVRGQECIGISGESLAANMPEDNFIVDVRQSRREEGEHMGLGVGIAIAWTNWRIDRAQRATLQRLEKRALCEGQKKNLEC
jgi:hypothetical protein